MKISKVDASKLMSIAENKVWGLWIRTSARKTIIFQIVARKTKAVMPRADSSTDLGACTPLIAWMIINTNRFVGTYVLSL